MSTTTCLSACSDGSRPDTTFASIRPAVSTRKQLFFGHTTAGDLLRLFPRALRHDDRQQARSRSATASIARAFALAPAEILFLSDVAAELDAAQQAGLQTCLVRRPGKCTDPSGLSAPADSPVYRAGIIGRFVNCCGSIQKRYRQSA